MLHYSGKSNFVKILSDHSEHNLSIKAATTVALSLRDNYTSVCKQFTALLAQTNCLIDNSWMCNTASYEYMSTSYQCQIITVNKKVSRNAKKMRVNSRVKNLNPLKSKCTDAEELWGHNNELRQSWALNIMLIFSSTVLFLDSSTALQSSKIILIIF